MCERCLDSSGVPPTQAQVDRTAGIAMHYDGGADPPEKGVGMPPKDTHESISMHSSTLSPAFPLPPSLDSPTSLILFGIRLHI